MTKCNHPELCEMFRYSAVWTYFKMSNAYKLDLKFNEETITENILLRLAENSNLSTANSELEIKSYTKYEERNSGADWLFVFSDEKFKISILIQAKRLYVDEITYKGFLDKDADEQKQLSKIENKQSDEKNIQAQITNLEYKAKEICNPNTTDVIPLYVMYNSDLFHEKYNHKKSSIDELPIFDSSIFNSSIFDIILFRDPFFSNLFSRKFFTYKHICQCIHRYIYPHFCCNNFYEHWGCAFISLAKMKKLKTNPSPSDISKMHPWHLLFHSKALISKKPSLPELVCESLKCIHKDEDEDIDEDIDEDEDFNIGVSEYGNDNISKCIRLLGLIKSEGKSESESKSESKSERESNIEELDGLFKKMNINGMINFKQSRD